jgi:hypothetical protein
VGKTTDKLMADVQQALVATKDALKAKDSVLSAISIHSEELGKLVKAQGARLKVITDKIHQFDKEMDADEEFQELERGIAIHTKLWQSAVAKRDSAVATLNSEFKQLDTKNQALVKYLVEKDTKTKLAISKKSIKAALEFYRETEKFLVSLT